MNTLLRRLRQIRFPEVPAGHNQNSSPHESLLPYHPKSSFDANPVAISSPIEYRANHDDSATAETSEWPLYDSPQSFNTMDERMLWQMRDREDEDAARQRAGLPALAPAASAAIAVLTPAVEEPSSKNLFPYRTESPFDENPAAISSPMGYRTNHDGSAAAEASEWPLYDSPQSFSTMDERMLWQMRDREDEDAARQRAGLPALAPAASAAIAVLSSAVEEPSSKNLFPYRTESPFDENPAAISSPMEYRANYDDSATAETSESEWPLYDSPQSFSTMDERMLWQMREREDQDAARQRAGLPALAPATSAAVAVLSPAVEETLPSNAPSGNMSYEGANTVLVNGANRSLVQSLTQENGYQGQKSTSANGLPAYQPTQCGCGKDKTHYPEQVWETVFPSTPEKIYDLIFASGFMKDFLAKDQKLMSLQISDWYPESEGSQLLARSMSYIKPLDGSVGPRQTKCELKEETVHVDFDSYISTVTTTRTPDVPSGGVFVCKTRTCIMWAGPASTNIIVTTDVEWSGRSFIKSMVEKSAFDGQRMYYSDLEHAMRKYISEHSSEFIPEGAPSDTHPSGSVAYADVGALITWIAPTPVKVNGGFGDVFTGTHSRAGKVALKRPRIDPTGYNEDLIRRFKREAETWEKLQHPHILEYLGSFQRDGQLYFVSPFIENGTLVEYLVLHPTVNRIKLLCEAADAISYLHAQDVVHGDIKANNLLVGDKGQVLLCDFGLTRTANSSTTTAMKGVGSLRWQSPELWDGDSKSFKSDVYAFGMTIAEVLTGDVPLPDLWAEGAIIRAVLMKNRRPTKIPAVSSTGLSYKRVWAVAEACWPTIPEERISMNEASRLIQEDLQLAVTREIDAVTR